jgi:hypothetical protein
MAMGILFALRWMAMGIIFALRTAHAQRQQKSWFGLVGGVWQLSLQTTLVRVAHSLILPVFLSRIARVLALALALALATVSAPACGMRHSATMSQVLFAKA